ncbi:MAG TPA: biopolymer transporter ExbD [Thermoguttaceae bacterium]|nr:biopolymer transporter ExbD [Thermoguttaceae bacterium]
MRIGERHQASAVELDMTPMIDMAFQLISFFLFALNFAGADMDERIRLPISELAKPPEAPFESPITLQLNQRGLVFFAGEEMAIPTLRSALRREREFLQYRGGDPAKATVIIRADARAKTGVVQELIKMCQETGFEKFAVAAKQQQGT